VIERNRLFAIRPDRGCVKALLPLALALALSGCGFLRGPPPETFDLTAPESIPVRGATAAQILIPEPSALKALDSERIVVTTGARISYYPDAQWPDRLPRLLQARAVQAFEQSRKARAVGRPGEGLSIDFQLLINIRSFEYVSDGDSGYAKVEISAKILNDRNGRVVSSKILTAEAPVAKDSAPAVVAGVDAAMNEVLVDLVSWTVGRI
jgi:cholesterol transport system auxiliary component